jgi:hypothetical protein
MNVLILVVMMGELHGLRCHYLQKLLMPGQIAVSSSFRAMTE